MAAKAPMQHRKQRRRRAAQGPPETAKGIIEHRIEGKLQARLLYKEDIVQKNIPGLFDRTCSLLSLEQPRVKEKHCFRC